MVSIAKSAANNSNPRSSTNYSNLRFNTNNSSLRNRSADWNFKSITWWALGDFLGWSTIVEHFEVHEFRNMCFLFDSLLANKGAWMWYVMPQKNNPKNRKNVISPILQEIF